MQESEKAFEYFLVLMHFVVGANDFYNGFMFSDTTGYFYGMIRVWDSAPNPATKLYNIDTVLRMGYSVIMLEVDSAKIPDYYLAYLPLTEFVYEQNEYKPFDPNKMSPLNSYYRVDAEYAMTFEEVFLLDRQKVYESPDRRLNILPLAPIGAESQSGWEFLIGVYMAYTSTVAVYCPNFFEVDRALTGQLTEYWMKRLVIIRSFDKNPIPLFESHDRFIFPISINKVWDAEGFVDLDESEWLKLTRQLKENNQNRDAKALDWDAPAAQTDNQLVRRSGLISEEAEINLFGKKIKRRGWDRSRLKLEIWDWGNFSVETIQDLAEGYEDAYYGSKNVSVAMTVASLVLRMRVPLGLVNPEIPRDALYKQYWAHRRENAMFNAAGDPFLRGGL